MREKGKISASIMCAGFDQVMDYVHEFERNHVEFLHVDVMDGTFVPNLAYGPDFVKRLRKKTDITLDCHLMVDRAEEKLDWFDFPSGRSCLSGRRIPRRLADWQCRVHAQLALCLRLRQ